jgi:Ca2+-binding RTX toxin-like protein
MSSRLAPGTLCGALLLAALVTLGWPILASSSAATARSGPDRAGSGAERAVPSCNGLVPTMVGSPGATLLGTAGNDVVLTKGATRVDTGAGDDSICVTGAGTAVVNAGPDNDFVGARAHRGNSFVSLGFGDDRFLGGAGGDRVWSQEASNQTSPDDYDVIISGDGNDYVISGSSAAANHDVVDLGPGDDALVTYGSTAGASLSGGVGINTLQPLFDVEDVGDWLIDNTTGRADLDGTNRLSWTSFQRFDLTALQGTRSRFLGSSADEWVVGGGTCRVVLRGRGGADRLTVDDAGCNNLPAGDAVLSGGPGDDRLTGASGNDVLRGGGGRDSADGGDGTDTCSTETTTFCE